MWLILRQHLERISNIGDSFDEVTRDQRYRIKRLEDFRERQIRYNRNERKRVLNVADRVEVLESLPIVKAVMQGKRVP